MFVLLFIKDFFVVPKRSSKASSSAENSWRLSFPDQERKYLLEGPNRVALKPLIKLLKASLDIYLYICVCRIH